MQFLRHPHSCETADCTVCAAAAAAAAAAQCSAVSPLLLNSVSFANQLERCNMSAPTWSRGGNSTIPMDRSKKVD